MHACRGGPYNVVIWHLLACRKRHVNAIKAMGRPNRVAWVCDAGAVAVVFDAQLWMWDARRDESWTFVSLPAAVSDDIRELADEPRRGFGAVRVRVTLGGSEWTTSIFPDTKRGCYV